MTQPVPKYLPGDILDFQPVDGSSCRLVVREIHFDGRQWQYELEEVDPDPLHAMRAIDGICRRCHLKAPLLGGICGNCGDDLRQEGDAERLAQR